MANRFVCEETQVYVKGFLVKTYVGHGSKERRQLQTVCVQVACILKNAFNRGDDLSNTFDYVPLVKVIRKLARKPRRLIETFARQIAKECFKHPNLNKVVITVGKPNKIEDVREVGTVMIFKRKGE